MKNTIFKSAVGVFAAGLLALSMTGCASVDVSNQGKNMVVVENSGCFLFYFIPLFSGDPDYPNQQVCNWFSNTVKVETNIRLLEEEAGKQGAHGLKNIVSHRDDETVIPLIFKRKIYKTSAELVK